MQVAAEDHAQGDGTHSKGAQGRLACKIADLLQKAGTKEMTRSDYEEPHLLSEKDYPKHKKYEQWLISLHATSQITQQKMLDQAKNSEKLLKSDEPQKKKIKMESRTSLQAGSMSMPHPKFPNEPTKWILINRWRFGSVLLC